MLRWRRSPAGDEFGVTAAIDGGSKDFKTISMRGRESGSDFGAGAGTSGAARSKRWISGVGVWDLFWSRGKWASRRCPFSV